MQIKRKKKNIFSMSDDLEQQLYVYSLHEGGVPVASM